MPELTIILIIIVFIFGAFLKGWSGFGTNFVVPPLMVMLGYELSTAIIITVSVNFVLNIIMILENRKFSINNLKSIWLLVLMAVIFTYVGVYMFSWVNDDILKIIAGSILLFVAFNRIFKFNFHIKDIKKYFIPTGILAGFLNGVANLAGAPMLVLYGSSTVDRETMKSTLVSFFLVMNILLIIGYIIFGEYTVAIATDVIYVVLFSVIACIIGISLSRKVSSVTFNKVMNYILLLFGLNMIYKGIFGTHIFFIYKLFV